VPGPLSGFLQTCPRAAADNTLSYGSGQSHMITWLRPCVFPDHLTRRNSGPSLHMTRWLEMRLIRPSYMS
jgi:hypothetical protein